LVAQPDPAADLLVRSVGRRIRDLRKERGLTHAEFGRRLGIAWRNVQRIESGRQNLTLRTLHAIAVVLGVEVRALLDTSPDPPED
jgi:transcriptional regulator with XRE-family HTH domain